MLNISRGLGLAEASKILLQGTVSGGEKGWAGMTWAGIGDWI